MILIAIFLCLLITSYIYILIRRRIMYDDDIFAVPSIQPRQVKAQVLSSRSVKLSWIITFAPAHDLIEGFFLGYRSRATQSGNGIQETPSYTYKTIKLMNSATNFRQQQTTTNSGNGANNNDNGSIQIQNKLIINGSNSNSNNNNLLLSSNNNNLPQQQQQQQPTTINDKTTSSIYLSPISSSLATVSSTSSMVSPSGGSGLQPLQKGSEQQLEMQQGTNGGDLIGAPSTNNQRQYASNLYSDNGQAMGLDNTIAGHSYNTMQQQLESSAGYYGGNMSNILITSTFEYVITNLERNTDYSILLQCYNRKGAGPSSEPLLLRTFANGNYSPFEL